MKRFMKSIDSQIELNQGKNIFHKLPGQLRFSRETIDAISNISELDSHAERFLVDYATDKVLEEFCRINQYLSFDVQSKNDLKRIYSELFADIRSKAYPPEEMAKSHYKKLKEWLKKHNSFAEKIYAGYSSEIEPVVCSEYSPEMQFEILQIDLKLILQPVLDIGCGKQARLVNFLKSKGIEAYGIDRFQFPGSQLATADWLEYDYGLKKWGTIVSNLGFSNHFNHHHLREDGNYIGYGKTYMQILCSLKTRGCFHYAPDLPFIEQYLELNQYLVKKFENGKYEFKTTIVERIK